MSESRRLAVVTSHPIQYQAPLWRALARTPGLEVKVFFASRAGAAPHVDAEFGRTVQWDVPLLDGYAWEVLPNRPLPPLGWRFDYRCPAIGPRLARGGFDAVLLVGSQYWYYRQAVRAARRHGLPILYRAETPPPHPGRAAALVADLERRRFFRQVAAFLCVGGSQRAFYQRHGVPPSRLHHAPYCVDNHFFRRAAERFEPRRAALRAAFGFGPDDRVVAFVGKFIPKKRPLDLVRAFARLASAGGWGLLMAGTGPLLDACREHVRANDVGRVTFTGFKNQTEVGAVYAAADGLVLPSDHGETWGLVVNEAMNFGLPIVVSDRVGCGPDLVHDGVNGHRYPAGNVEALARALEDTLGDRARGAGMGRRSRALVEAYSLEASVGGVVEALAAVAHRPGAARAPAGTAAGRSP